MTSQRVYSSKTTTCYKTISSIQFIKPQKDVCFSASLENQRLRETIVFAIYVEVSSFPNLSCTLSQVRVVNSTWVRYGAHLYTFAPATCLGRPKWSPACEAPLFDPIWSPITCSPCLSCSSVNSRLLAVASLGPSWGTGMPDEYAYWTKDKNRSKADISTQNSEQLKNMTVWAYLSG